METKDNERITEKTDVVIDLDKVEDKQESGKPEKAKSKKELSPADIKKRNKMVAIPIMVLIFCAAMYFIYSLSSGDKDKQKTETIGGFNPNIPQPKEDGMISDKRKAYEMDQLTQSKNERMQTLEQVSEQLNAELSPDENGLSTNLDSSSQKQKPSSIQNSANAYRDMNRELSSFYQPSDNAKTLELEKKVEELSSKLEATQAEKGSNEQQLQMMEKSYQMASKYLTGETENPSNAAGLNKRNNVAPASVVKDKTVSGLQQQVTDSAFIAQYSAERNMGFATAVGNQSQLSKNTIKACVNDNQTLVDGQSVRFHLLEPMLAGKFIIPQNTLISGVAKLQGERLNISVTGIEYAGNIILVELSVFDTDGLAGINIPGSMEMNATKEAAANIGAGMGSSFTVNQNAGAAIVSDLAKGVIQSGSQYLSKKFREVKVNLKAGYEVMLYSKQE